MTHKIVLSCMQPTQGLHIGNYLGALKNWVDLQEDRNALCFYGIVDLHAITAGHDPASLLTRTREAAAAYIACGVDPGCSILFVQSAIPEHVQLMWLLASCAQLGKLGRMTQFKDKSGKNEEKSPLGLFAYPVLMAADILLYKATHVPVGEDQVQHIELARDIAATFNTKYAPDFFPLPAALLPKNAYRVMSLRDGRVKMSKSDPSAMSRISLSDDADAIARKIQKAKTDEGAFPASLEEAKNRPEAQNLISLYAALTGQDAQSVMRTFGGKPFSVFKPALAEVTVAALAPISHKMRALMEDTAYLDTVLAEGSARARALAAPTLAKVQDIMGFWRTF